MMHLEADVFTKFDKQWALVTAGTPEHYNTMTISWGGLGTLWERPVATVYVKKNTSGRDGDKVAAAGLTPELLPRGITFRQAETTLVCRKIYCQDLDLEQIPQEVRDAFYKDEPVHRMYIGEVVEIIEG